MATLVGNVVYGSYKDGSDIYKDSKGYYIVSYNPVKNELYKKHLKSWKPAADTKTICRVGKKMKFCRNKTHKRKRARKATTHKRV